MMTEQKPPPRSKATDDRAARLAEQLRANLRKRKTQARGADGVETEARHSREGGKPSPDGA